MEDAILTARSLRAWLVIFAMLLLVAALTLVFALPRLSARLQGLIPTSPILWSGGDSMDWLAAWGADRGGGIYTTGTGTAALALGVLHDGKPAVRLSISDADGEHGNQAVRLFRWNEATAYAQAYYSVWFLFPQVYHPAQWWNVFQWKSKTATRDDPFFILNVGNRPDGEMYFYLYDWQSQKNYEQAKANIPVNTWVHIEAYYQVAPDNTGRVTFWQDGVQLFDVKNAQTRYPDGDAQWSIDNYTDNISPSQADLYVSEPTISRTR